MISAFLDIPSITEIPSCTHKFTSCRQPRACALALVVERLGSVAQKYSAIYATTSRWCSRHHEEAQPPIIFSARASKIPCLLSPFFAARKMVAPSASLSRRTEPKQITHPTAYVCDSRPGRTQTTPSMGPRKRRRNTKAFSPDSRAKSHKSQQRCSVMVHKRQSLHLFAALRWTTVDKNPADPAQNVPRTSSYRPLYGCRNTLVRDLFSTCNSSRHEIGPNIHVVHKHKGSRSPTLGASIVDGTTCAFDGFLTKEQGPDKRQPPSGVCSRGI